MLNRSIAEVFSSMVLSDSMFVVLYDTRRIHSSSGSVSQDGPKSRHEFNELPPRPPPLLFSAAPIRWGGFSKCSMLNSLRLYKDFRVVSMGLNTYINL